MEAETGFRPARKRDSVNWDMQPLKLGDGADRTSLVFIAITDENQSRDIAAGNFGHAAGKRPFDVCSKTGVARSRAEVKTAGEFLSLERTRVSREWGHPLPIRAPVAFEFIDDGASAFEIRGRHAVGCVYESNYAGFGLGHSDPRLGKSE